jgi:hypothetical protein
MVSIGLSALLLSQCVDSNLLVCLLPPPESRLLRHLRCDEPGAAPPNPEQRAVLLPPPARVAAGADVHAQEDAGSLPHPANLLCAGEAVRVLAAESHLLVVLQRADVTTTLR